MIWLNCDMGEGAGNEELIMPYLDAASISCGYHAGDETGIRQTLQLAREHGVKIGAHPSFDDRANFGRIEQDLPGEEIYRLVFEQLVLFHRMNRAAGTDWLYVKPHGALYNQAARNPASAQAIAQAVHDFNPLLGLFALAGSRLSTKGKNMGLRVYEEGFADRRYSADGSLVPRNQSGALIETVNEMRAQLENLLEGFVISKEGTRIPLKVDTICIHGDGSLAADFVKAAHLLLKSNL